MDLETLAVRRGFRLRGRDPTRLETFVDAAFAFAVTLLVVSFGAMPDTFAELYDALRRLPAFLGGFAVLALFWHAHYRFSRWYGLEDGVVMLLSLALVATALFYVFPLRMVMSAAMYFFSGGWAPRELEVSTVGEFRAVFVLYGVGFAVFAMLIAALYAHALRRRGELRLDAAEVVMTRGVIGTQAILMGCALLSVAIALLVPRMQGWLQALPGLAYMLLSVLLPLHEIRVERRARIALARRVHE